jgi:hypothetical protein
MGARRPAPVLLVAVAALAWPAAADARSPEASAAIAAVQTTTRPDDCHATMDFSRAEATATPYAQVTRYRPAGYDVTVPGLSEPKASQAPFTSRWLVTSGYAYPQNIAAARLRAGCRSTTFAPNTALSWHALSYLDPNTGAIEAWSNEGWTNARRVRALDTTTYQNQLDQEKSMAVWPTCTRARETVRFARTLHLLGDPEELRISVLGVVKGLRVWPFSSIVLRLNDRVVGRRTTPGFIEQELTADQLRGVVGGANTIDIRVTKRKTRSCNGSSRRKLGVLIGVIGRQAWHVRISRPPPQSTQSGGIPTIPFTMTNDGPSILLEPRFHFSVAYDQDVDSVPPTVEGNTNCATNATQQGVVCGAQPLSRGDSLTFPVSFAAKPKGREIGDTSPYVVRFTEYWDGSWFESGFAGGSFCSSNATNCPSGGA